MTTGENVRLYRLLRGLSQAELGELIGIDQSYLARYETDRLKLPNKYVPDLAQELGVETEWLGFKSKPPYSLYVGNPITNQMKARQVGGIAKALLPTLRSFFEEIELSAAFRAQGTNGVVYLLTVHHLNQRGIAFGEGSVLVFSLTTTQGELLQPVINLLADMSTEVTLDEEDIAAFRNFDRSTSTDFVPVVRALESFLNVAREKVAAWIDPRRIIDQWQLLLTHHAQRTVWFINMNLKVESNKPLTREQAFELARNAIDSGSTLFENKLTISVVD